MRNQMFHTTITRFLMGVSCVLGISVQPVVGQQKNADYLSYIETWRKTALEQQRLHGIPASITLAQALLESAAGKSNLAVKANNHFGIKCTSDWKGRTYTYDDDRRNECFRRYSNAADSYEDHSLFLMRSRYDMLRRLPVDDYKNWAYGLKTCGYATDPNYPEKLIRLIELYDLQNLSSDAAFVAHGEGSSGGKQSSDAMPVLIADKEQSGDTDMEENKLTLFANHTSGKQNGVRYIIAEAGESYASLAFYLNMSEKTLRRYNDAGTNDQLQAGERVYIYPKKRRANRQHPTCVFKSGDTVRSIAQRYGIRVSSIYKLNAIPEGTPLTEAQELRIR